MDNKVEGKVLSVESSFVNEKIELKLDYLNQLVDVSNTFNKMYGTDVTHELTAKRIVRVCNSIEEDLGIKKEIVASNIVVNLSVGTSDFERKLTELSKMTAESAERIANSMRDAAKRISQS
ncbi:hypothetical protein GOL43_34230 [Sinorhizobium medicae]|nr:hypothetical protein [Sinorhizobium medicae]